MSEGIEQAQDLIQEAQQPGPPAPYSKQRLTVLDSAPFEGPKDGEDTQVLPARLCVCPNTACAREAACQLGSAPGASAARLPHTLSSSAASRCPASSSSSSGSSSSSSSSSLQGWLRV